MPLTALRHALLGRGRAALTAASRAAPIITETGAYIAKEAPELTNPTILDRLKQVGLNAKGLIGGEQPIDVWKQRFAQGGVFGRGGLMHGSMAFSPEVYNHIKTHGWRSALKNKPGALLGNLSNPALTVAVPAYAAYRAKQRGEGIGGIVGETIGYGVGAPFGVAGFMLGGQAGRAVGEAVGGSKHQGHVPKVIDAAPYVESGAQATGDFIQDQAGNVLPAYAGVPMPQPELGPLPYPEDAYVSPGYLQSTAVKTAAYNIGRKVAVRSCAKRI